MLNNKKQLQLEIVSMLLLIFVTIPIWNSYDNTGFIIAKKYSAYEIENYNNIVTVRSFLEKVDDEYAIKNIKTQNIIISNINNNEQKHNLVLKFDKFSQLDIDNLRINVNYNIDYLKEYNYYEDEKNYYFVIDNNNILNKKYMLSLWIDEKSTSTDSLLECQFIVI